MVKNEKEGSKKPDKKEDDKVEKLIELLASKELKQAEAEKQAEEELKQQDKKLTRIAKEKKARIRHRYATEPMVNIYLEPAADKITNIVDIRDPEDKDFLKNKKTIRYDSYGVPLKVEICNYKYYVPRGVSCFIPKSVFDEIQASRKITMQSTQKVRDMQRENAKKLRSE